MSGVQVILTTGILRVWCSCKSGQIHQWNGVANAETYPHTCEATWSTTKAPRQFSKGRMVFLVEVQCNIYIKKAFFFLEMDRPKCER